MTTPKDRIIAEHEWAIARAAKTNISRSLASVLESVLDDEDDLLPCLACHL